MHSDLETGSTNPLGEVFGCALQLIKGARTIAISGHTSPDGDALGSVLGLGLSIRKSFPDKRVSMLLADDAPVPRIYRFLAGADGLVPAARHEGAPDLFISVDCPTIERLADAGAVARSAASRIVFDHHPSKKEFGDVVVRKVDAAATAVLVFDFLSWAGIGVEPEVATCLLCGLVTDTGRFQYQNADPAAFRCASHLVSCGAEPARIALEVYQSQRIQYLQLESRVMERIRIVADGRVAYSYAFASDLDELGVSSDECDGLVDVVRSVMGVEVCLFLKEVGDGRVRGNLRSKCELDVSAIASIFGGGGHAAAAGFSYPGTIDETLGAALPLLVELVGADVSKLPLENLRVL